MAVLRVYRECVCLLMQIERDAMGELMNQRKVLQFPLQSAFQLLSLRNLISFTRFTDFSHNLDFCLAHSR